MNRSALVFFTVVGCVSVVGGRVAAGDGAARDTDREATVTAAGEARVAGEAPAAGMRVYVDPETGEYAAPPAQRPRTEIQASSEPRARQIEDLVEVANPEGGYTIDLKRRLFGQARARVAAGTFEVECDTGDQAENR